jgi:hypothetical protein
VEANARPRSPGPRRPLALYGNGMEAVSKFGRRSKSCHDLGSHAFRFPHPNPLLEGEGATYGRCTILSPFGRGTQGEGNRATMSAILRVLRQSPRRAPTIQNEGHFLCAASFQRTSGKWFKNMGTGSTCFSAEPEPPRERGPNPVGTRLPAHLRGFVS